MKRLSRPFHKWVFFHFFEFIHYYIGAILSLYFLHYFQSEIPLLTKKLADLITEDNLSSFSLSYFLLLAIAILLFRTLSRLLFFYPARVQQKNLRIELLDWLERAFPKSYANYSDGEIFSHLYNDLNRLRAFIGFALLQVGNIVIASLVFIPKLREFNQDFLFAFIPVLACVGIFMVSMYFLYPINKKIMEKHANLQNFIIESYEAKHTIKNYSKESSILSNFRLICSEELKYFFRYDFGITIPFNLIKVGVACSLVWAAVVVFENKMQSSDLIFFSGFLFLILEPLMSLSWIGIVFSQGYGSWSRIKKLIASLDDEKKKGEVSLDIELPFWDKKIKLSFEENAWNMMAGDTGVGKSFLMEELAIYLARNKASYSFIQQEPFMYNDTIEANIFLGLERTEEKKKEVREYLKAFGLDTLGKDLDEVLALEIGENGKKVSGGQAKRIALIRSLISDVDIILWDDPFSSVDLILEDQILKYLKNKKLTEKTFVLTSHRLSTVRNSDYVILLDKDLGVVEEGETLKLLKSESKVYEYFRKQLV